jgi:hypothetical protein
MSVSGMLQGTNSKSNWHDVFISRMHILVRLNLSSPLMTFHIPTHSNSLTFLNLLYMFQFLFLLGNAIATKQRIYQHVWVLLTKPLPSEKPYTVYTDKIIYSAIHWFRKKCLPCEGLETPFFGKYNNAITIRLPLKFTNKNHIYNK